MVDVAPMPANAFGSVPTPALVAPIEFTLLLADYAALGGHVDGCGGSTTCSRRAMRERARGNVSVDGAVGAHERARPQIAGCCRMARLHLQHGPIDLSSRPGARRGNRGGLRGRGASVSPTVLAELCANCRCCARPSAAPCAGGSVARRMTRAVRAVSPSRSSRRWPRSPARSPTRCWRR